MNTFWAGSEESWNIVLKAEKHVSEGKLAGRYADNAPEDQFPSLWSKQGTTAIIHATGSMVDGQAGWMRYFGVIGYDDLAAAAIAAYSDPDVKSVLWQINSGGGHVNGISEMGKLTGQLSTLKPSATFTANQMASAAYWLGSSVQGPIMASQTAEVGSIGVITVHTEYSKMDAMDGVTRTVMRSGENKALANPIEPLSDKAKAQVESQLKDVHGIFRSAVAANRPNLTSEDLMAVTDGSTFLGKRAVNAGLVDKVATYDQALKLLDKPAAKKDTSKNLKGSTMNVLLTDAQIAIIQAGGTIENLPAGAAASTEPAAEPAAEPAPAATTPAPEPAPAEASAKPAAADQGVVALLQSQLSTAQASLMAINAELVTLKATTQTQAASHDGLLKIARAAIGKMAIALGGTDASAQTLDATAAITEHERICGVFKEKFKVGQASAGTPADGAAPAEKVDPLFLSRLQAGKSTTK